MGYGPRSQKRPLRVVESSPPVVDPLHQVPVAHVLLYVYDPPGKSVSLTHPDPLRVFRRSKDLRGPLRTGDFTASTSRSCCLSQTSRGVRKLLSGKTLSDGGVGVLEDFWHPIRGGMECGKTVGYGRLATTVVHPYPSPTRVTVSTLSWDFQLRGDPRRTS